MSAIGIQALHLLYMYYVLPGYIVNMNIHDVNNDHVHLCIAYMNTCAGTSARQQQLSLLQFHYCLRATTLVLCVTLPLKPLAAQFAFWVADSIPPVPVNL